MTPESIHREIPEVGALFRFDEVLGHFALFTWERYTPAAPALTQASARAHGRGP